MLLCSCGKTSLLQQLEDRLKQQGRKVGVLHLQRAYLQKIGENELDAEKFSDFFRRTMGIAWPDLLSINAMTTLHHTMQPDADMQPYDMPCPKSTADYVLLVDETQKIYTDYPEFWLRVKSIAETEAECGVHMAFFSVYGDTSQSPTVPAGRGTPFIPNKVLGADFLQCSLDETKELVADFSKRTGTKHLPGIAPILHAFTGGHIGMIHALLEALYHHFKRLTGKPYNLDTTKNFLLSVYKKII